MKKRRSFDLMAARFSSPANVASRRIAFYGSRTSREKVRNAVRGVQSEILKYDGLDNAVEIVFEIADG
jgi:hypothetical protein